MLQPRACPERSRRGNALISAHMSRLPQGQRCRATAVQGGRSARGVARGPASGRVQRRAAGRFGVRRLDAAFSPGRVCEKRKPRASSAAAGDVGKAEGNGLGAVGGRSGERAVFRAIRRLMIAGLKGNWKALMSHNALSLAQDAFSPSGAQCYSPGQRHGGSRQSAVGRRQSGVWPPVLRP